MRKRYRRSWFYSRKYRSLKGVPAGRVDWRAFEDVHAEQRVFHPMQEGIVFRPRLGFRIPVVFAFVFWLVTGITLVLLDLVSSVVIASQAYGAVALFCLFFLAVVFHYHHFAIHLDLSGITIVGAVSFKSFTWDEIVKVDGTSVFFPGAQVYMRSGEAFGFSGLVFLEHKQILDLIALYSGSR